MLACSLDTIFAARGTGGNDLLVEVLLSMMFWCRQIMVGFEVKRLLAYVSGNNRHNDGLSCQDIGGVLHQRLSSQIISSTHTRARHDSWSNGPIHIILGGAVARNGAKWYTR